MIVGIRIVRVAQDREQRERRNELTDEVEPLGAERAKQLADAGGVAARPIEARHDAELDRVGADHEHDR